MLRFPTTLGAGKNHSYSLGLNFAYHIYRRYHQGLESIRRPGRNTRAKQWVLEFDATWYNVELFEVFEIILIKDGQHLSSELI